MELVFEYYRELGAGSTPQVIHMMDNGVRVIYFDGNQTANCMETFPELGIYETLIFDGIGRVSTDSQIVYPSLKKMAHYGGFGFWSADGCHKFVMYMLPMDISHTLDSGNVSYAKDSAISQLSLKLLNSGGELISRYRSIITPGSMLEIYAAFGISDEVSLGRFYIDRSSIGYPEQDISITARNSIGKLLKEQTFNENASFDVAILQDNFTAILTLAGIESFFIADPQKTWRLSFKSDMDLLDGLTQVIKLLPRWQISENTDGTVGIGPITDIRFEQPGTYEFERDKSCWSYNIEYDDSQTVSKICIKCSNPALTLWRTMPVHLWWTVPTEKTLFLEVPDGTTIAEMNGMMDELETAMAVAGRQETFAGIFTPHLLIGDTIELVEMDSGRNAIGTVTSVRHSFGRSGFYTEFTVDSGGMKGKLFLKDLVGQISGNKKPAGVVIS